MSRTLVLERPRAFELREILHIDMDAFFASVEQHDDPRLRGKPVLVGGASRRGVVAAASYEARVFGCKSAMPMHEALRRCPQAIVVSPTRGRYEEVSSQVFEIFNRYTPLVEGLSLDEAFLDVTGSRSLFGDGETIARAIRKDVFEVTGLTCSAGVASSKFAAKIASDVNKPDGITIVGPDVAAFLAPLPLERMWGIGPKTAPTLRRLGYSTLGDLARADAAALERILGAWGAEVRELARGIDVREVEPDRDAKSIGAECTYEEDLTTKEAIGRTLLAHAARVAERLTEAGLTAGAIVVKLKYADFTLLTRRKTLARAGERHDDPPRHEPRAARALPARRRAHPAHRRVRAGHRPGRRPADALPGPRRGAPPRPRVHPPRRKGPLRRAAHHVRDAPRGHGRQGRPHRRHVAPAPMTTSRSITAGCALALVTVFGGCDAPRSPSALDDASTSDTQKGMGRGKRDATAPDSSTTPDSGGAALPTTLSVELQPQVASTASRRINFAVPLAPGQLTSADRIQVRAGGAALPTARRALATWPGGSLRSVQLQFDLAVPAVTTIAITLGEAASSTIALVPVEQTLATADGTTGPAVWAVLPATWLSTSRVAGPSRPSAQVAGTPQAAWDRICDYAAFGTSAFTPIQGDQGSWLYDRPTALYRGYQRTGSLTAASVCVP